MCLFHHGYASHGGGGVVALCAYKRHRLFRTHTHTHTSAAAMSSVLFWGFAAFGVSTSFLLVKKK